MNYATIVSTALSYSDRETDVELTNRIDDFLRIVESRINRVLKVQKMSVRTLLTTAADQEYYGLPADFAGLRDIEMRAQDDTDGAARNRYTGEYLSPEQMNTAVSFNENASNFYYTVIANQLQISPPQDGMVMELVYYRKLPDLTENDSVNWMSEDNPDAYIFGLMVEVSAFVKNAGATDLWNARFKESLGEIDVDDSLSRWSGTALQVRNG